MVPLIPNVSRMSGDISQSPLFDLLQSKLGWIDSRQRVLAQNIANVDTPGYRPRDVAPFAAVLNQQEVEAVRTNPLHLASLSEPVTTQQTVVSERAPDGNAVGLENQLTKMADNENAQAITSNIWKTYMGMFMTALGHG